MFVYKLSGCYFESSCSHLNFRFHPCFQQGVLWHSSNYRVWIHSQTRTWRDKNIQSNKMTFLDFNVIREEGTFTTNIYRKPTFSCANTHFGCFLRNTYKVGMIYTLVNRFSHICSTWSMFRSQLKLLREIFQKMVTHKT